MTERGSGASALWAAITVALFSPYLSPMLFGVGVLAALILSLPAGWRLPPVTLAAAVVAGATLLLPSITAPLWRLADWCMSVERAFGIPVAIDPGIILSRAIFVFALYGIVGCDRKAIRLGMLFNAFAFAAGLLLLGIVASRLSLRFLDVATIVLVFWGTLLLGNLLIAMRVLRRGHADWSSPTVLIFAAYGIAVGLVASSISLSRAQTSESPPFEPPLIGVFASHGPDFKRDFGTSTDEFGMGNIGLFGDMPEFLRRLGYRTVTLDSLAGIPPDVRCIFCPSFSRLLADAEYAAVEEFLQGGGRMVAVAEHTNLDGNADVLNPLLKPHGLSVNFDNTNGLIGEGLTGAAPVRGPLGMALSLTPYLTHNRGASLSIDGGLASPVLIGDFWQADRGDSLYPDRGYLSDGRFSPGDQLGNVILMAYVEAGKGLIFVSGDSSPFLNQNLAYNAPFLARLFKLLTSSASLESPRLILMAAMLLASALVAALWTVPRLRRALSAGALAALGVAGVLFAIVERGTRNDAMILGSTQWAVISTRENNALDRDPFSPGSPTALALQVFRAGRVPLVGDWQSAGRDAKLVFIINPGIVPTRDELDRLSKRVKSGGHLVLSGDGNNRAFIRTAEYFGFQITDEPLGSLSGVGLTTYTAWRVRKVPATAQALIAGDVIIGGDVSWGSGRVTLIADGGFLLSKNLETESTFDEANCNFVRSLLEEKPR